MDRLKAAELREFLLADKEVRILFVEGSNDLEFWRAAVPERDRKNAVIWPISTIEIAGAHGGERGRLIQLANAVVKWPEVSRLQFFADADHDRILGKSPPSNVVFTDGRDMESYAFENEVCKRICRMGCALDEQDSRDIIAAIGSVLRPVAYLRILSDRLTLQLPFQKTFQDGTIKRFFRKSKKNRHLLLENLIDALLANRPEISIKKSTILEEISKYDHNLRNTSNFEILHGKDCIAYLAWCVPLSYDIAVGIVTLGRGNYIAEVLRHPNISSVQRWCLLAT